MNILIADERKKYHQALLNNGVLTIDKNGVPSNADTSSRLSKAIAKDIADRLMAETHEKATTMDFHHHLGYRLVGEFYQCGYKFDTWYNMVWMEKIIGEHQKKQPAMITFPELLKKDPTPWEA